MINSEKVTGSVLNELEYPVELTPDLSEEVSVDSDSDSSEDIFFPWWKDPAWK